MHTPHILHDFDQAIATLRGEVLAMAGRRATISNVPSAPAGTQQRTRQRGDRR
jgi:hypothetical protein